MSGYRTNMENNRNCLRRITSHDEQQYSKDSLVNIMEKFVKTVNIMDETILVPCRLMDMQVGDSTDIIQTPAQTSTNSIITGNMKKSKRGRKNVHEFLNSADLYNLYTMLNSMKTGLLWTRSSDEETNENNDDDGSESSTSTILESEDRFDGQQQTGKTTSNTTQQQSQKGHVRRPSTASMASSNSVSNLSDSESEISNENDSGIESSDNCIKSSASSSSSDDGQQNNQKQKQNIDKATDLARKCRQHLSGLHKCLEQMTEAANYLTARYQSDIGPV